MHTFATAHVRDKTSLKVLQAALGHANLASTSRYVGLVAEKMTKHLQEHALYQSTRPCACLCGQHAPVWTLSGVSRVCRLARR